MAMKEVTTLIHDMKKWVNRPLIGYYLGSTSYPDTTYGKTQFVHSFKLESGEELSIYGYTTLDTRMAKVPLGVLCQVTYLGAVPTQTKKYGLKDVHQCEVLMDVDRRIETDHLPEPAPATAPAHAPAAQAPSAPPARGKSGTKTNAQAPATRPEYNEDPPF
jgi:hypothetical protein